MLYLKSRVVMFAMDKGAVNMLRWLLGWDDSKKQQDKKSIKPAQRWVSDDQGGYVKHSTARAIASFAGEAAAQQAPKLGAGVDGLKVNGFSDESSFPIEGVQDALSAYQAELTSTMADLQASLTKWMDKKVEIIGSDTDLTRYADSLNHSHPGTDLIAGIKAFFAQIFENIKTDFIPASTELHQLLEVAHSHVQSLCDHIDTSCQKLDDKEKSSEEKRRICIDICNDSIQIVNDLIAMIENIQDELDYCLKSEGLTEQAAKTLVQLIVLIVVKVPMPELDFNFKSSYRHFLYNEIEGEKKEIELFETDVKGHLAHAMQEILVLAGDRDNATKPSAEEKPDSDLLSGSLFAPTPSSTPASSNTLDLPQLASSRL